MISPVYKLLGALPLWLALSMASLPVSAQFPTEPADTGVSGVYEVMVGVEDADKAVEHFKLFGFRVIQTGEFTAAESRALYGVSSALKSVRMQNAGVDAHGLLRILEWENLAPGVGYAPPDTPGQRMAVMRTADIMRIVDVFKDERALGQPWLVIEPTLDVIYQDANKSPGLYENRRIGVRETSIWGQWFNHIFFQRYGYDVPGYGYINEGSVFRTSEFTHHDFIQDKPLDETVGYYVRALGFQPEQEQPVIDGDWQTGARVVFAMPPGHSHQYIGMRSPNDVSGKLKFFYPFDRTARSRMDRVAVNAEGINMHSLYVDDVGLVRTLLRRERIRPSAIRLNEYGEESLVFTGPDGAIWQILRLRQPPTRPPVRDFKTIPVNH
ncbi:MAG: hypothetical protein ISN29_03755 [Gammaproteobacteria bacterium AqS3]|nr:hypothetical protein [Gammaproteobacteria bacterium AqS3]